MVYIYIIKQNNNIVYVGQSVDPKRRFKDHKQKKFKNVTNLTYEIIDQADDRKNGYIKENHYQLKYNLKQNDKIAKQNAGKIGGKKVGNINKTNGTLKKATEEARKVTSKQIVCFNGSEYTQYKSIIEASKKLGIYKEGIIAVLKKRKENFKGYIFEYKVD